MALAIGSNRLTQADHARVGAVPGLAVLQRFDARLPYVPRRGKIRLADGEGDHVVHLGGNVKKPSDAGGLQFLHGLVHQFCVIHGLQGTSLIHILAEEQHPAILIPPQHKVRRGGNDRVER